MGNIVSIAVAGDYEGWRAGLESFGIEVAFGFLALYLIHKLTDTLLAPVVKLVAEQVEEQLGAVDLELAAADLERIDEIYPAPLPKA
mgnify:CR=1 FL=1